jgi:PKD repeat protein
MTITVEDITNPVANAGPDNSTNEDSSIYFDGSASTDNVGVISYAWDIDASNGINWGSPDYTGSTPSHTYFMPNAVGYTVTLNVTDAAGNSDLDTLTVIVYDITSPTANAGPDDTINEDAPYVFDASGSSDNVGITNYAWDMDDSDGINWGSPDYFGANLWNPVHTFLQPGVYTVTLNVTDGAGLSDIDQVQITVLDITSPTANAGPDVRRWEH